MTVRDDVCEADARAAGLEVGQMERVVCCCCGADEPRDTLEAAENIYETGGTFYFRTCGRCGHWYLNPRPTLDVIGRYYPDVYYDKEEGRDPAKNRPISHQGTGRVRRVQEVLVKHYRYPATDGIDSTPTFMSRAHAWRMRRSRRRDFIPWVGQGRLLDFGMGDGRFLRLQRQRGWIVAGMDFNPKVAQWASEIDGIEAQPGTWPGPAFEGRQFDAITAFHVLEHHPDPPAFLSAAIERLAPGGMLWIEVPNGASWSLDWFGRDWPGVDVPRHFSMFTPQVLSKLMSDAGLEGVSVTQFPRPTMMRQSAKNRGKRTGSGWWKFAAKLRLPWSILGHFSKTAGRADVITVTGRKS